ncbi:MAG: HD domain-containing protein [Eubacteriales bacterium]
MKYYEHLYNTHEINMVLNSINNVYEKYHPRIYAHCHGWYHAMFVVNTIEYILKSLSYDIKIIELGKIAGLLHDIGMIAGRREHGRKSAALAEIIFDGSEHLLLREIPQNERKIIFHAIEDHDSSKNKSSVIGAALFIADKLDFSKNRVLPVPVEKQDDVYKNGLEINNVDINVSGKVIIVNAITTKAFSKEMFMKWYSYPYSLILKEADYLGCTCNLYFNGTDERYAN